MEPVDIRLELVKAMIPTASRHGLMGGEIVSTCTLLEKYVLGSVPSEETPASPPRKTLTRPVKDNQVPDFLSR